MKTIVGALMALMLVFGAAGAFGPVWAQEDAAAPEGQAETAPAAEQVETVAVLPEAQLYS